MFLVKLNDLVGAAETFELSLKLASLVGDEQAQDAIKKALKDVNSRTSTVEGLRADDNPDDDETTQDEQQPQAAEEDGEKQEAEDDGEKATESTEQEQVNA